MVNFESGFEFSGNQRHRRPFGQQPALEAFGRSPVCTILIGIYAENGRQAVYSSPRAARSIPRTGAEATEVVPRRGGVQGGPERSLVLVLSFGDDPSCCASSPSLPLEGLLTIAGSISLVGGPRESLFPAVGVAPSCRHVCVPDLGH